AKAEKKKARPPARSAPAPRPAAAEREEMAADDFGDYDEGPSPVDAEVLARSMSARTKAASISGLTRYDLGEKLTVPDGTSTMVAIINEKVQGEETFLFRPGGAGSGY